MKQPIISVKNIAKNYQQKEVIKNVSFDDYSEEIIALLGENGAGKSTLIKIINDTIISSQGHVIFYDGSLSR